MEVRRERWGGQEGRAGWGCRGEMGEGGGGEEGRGGMQGEECGTGRAGEAGKRAPAAGGREGLPCEEGGAGITGPSQPRAPGRAGRAARAEAGAPRAGTASLSCRAARARGRTPTPLTLSDHGFEANGSHRGARVSGLPVSSGDAGGHDYLPGSARSAGHRPPLRSRARARLTRGLAAEARREPERGCRPAGARARAGPARGGALCQPSASPARLRQSHCGPGARPRPPRCGWTRGGPWLARKPRPPPHLTRRAHPASRALRGRRVLKSPPPASAPGHKLVTSSLFLKPRYVLSFPFLGILHFSPARTRNSETPHHKTTGGLSTSSLPGYLDPHTHRSLSSYGPGSTLSALLHHLIKSSQ